MQPTKNNKMTNDFAWDVLASESRMIPNTAILQKYGEKVYCHLPYANDLFNLINGSSSTVMNKEPKVGKTLSIIDVIRITPNEIVVLMEGFLEGSINMLQEKKFLQMHNITHEGFINWISSTDGKTEFLSQSIKVCIEAVHPFVKVGLHAGYMQKQREDFFSQISSPTTAYQGTITGKNQGGFIINVMGLDGFLPGSLAATNIVRDFDSMVGKTIPVMVEDYLNESQIFVFSYKKYVSTVLPSAIESLSADKKYVGNVTGVAKYGVFIEFDEIFTGLLHSSKMTPEMRDRYRKSEIKAGQEIEFWIKEITADKKIILTDEDPSIRKRELDEFREKNQGSVRGGEVVSVQPFGALVKLQKDIVGLISQKEIRSKKKKFTVGEQIMVTVEKVQDNKIFLTIPNEA